MGFNFLRIAPTTWGISFIADLLIFVKAHKIKMIDDMCLYLSEIADEIEKKKDRK